MSAPTDMPHRLLTAAGIYLRQRGYVFARVCLSVCDQDNSESYGRIFLKFSGNVGNGKNYISDSILGVIRKLWNFR